MKVVDMLKKGNGKKSVEVTVLEAELINQRGELVLKSRSRLIEK
jgi:hypothetical protein